MNVSQVSYPCERGDCIRCPGTVCGFPCSHDCHEEADAA